MTFNILSVQASNMTSAILLKKEKKSNNGPEIITVNMELLLEKYKD